MTALLTPWMVSQLADVPRHLVELWATERGITPAATPRGPRYPADQVLTAVAYDRRLRSDPPPVRLARFIRNPLNHAA